MRRQILIVTKTYPSISQKYRETVCTAGILLDKNQQPQQWIRIYPIRFRYLETDNKYKRWSIIEADIERNPKDHRKESFRIDDTSIDVICTIGTQNNWADRKKLVLPLQFRSIDEMQELDASVGIIKPATIHHYFDEATEREWSPKQQAVLDQEDLFDESFPLDKIPYKFGYRFTDEDGKTHKYSISDWEIAQLYRNCVKRSQANTEAGREQDALQQVRKKLETDFLQNKDLYFVVGNLKNRPKTFMTIGLFYPPKSDSQQLDLF
ncbi:MAG: hypothetical protein HC795_09735 [Coleofasciculaceae cyanobacterium RL_1_1]|nr:hypothetical protein [Coleofasciculaceae cyanobacterium RL_1_1]